MRNYVTEFIGTFFLVLTIGLSVALGGGLAPIAIGAGLMVMVFMGGHISGAHYNPAITLAVWMRGKVPTKEVPGYVIAQIAAALVAAFLVSRITHQPFASPPAGMHLKAALAVEVLFTFALALVVLNVATAPATSGNSFYGVAIGFTVASAAIAGGSISGGAFNPAVGIAITLGAAMTGAKGNPAALVWIYLVAPPVGAALAAVVYKFQHPVDTKPAPPKAEEMPEQELLLRRLNDRVRSLEASTRPETTSRPVPSEEVAR